MQPTIVGSTTTTYYLAGNSRVAMRTSSSVYYLLSDQLGSTSITATGSGTKVSELRYKAWGEVRYTSGTTATKYTYTGQYSNMADFGLMFYNARWYDPTIGRFVQTDSIVPDGLQGYDRYAYANNSPLDFNDPSGHISCYGDNYDDGPGCLKIKDSALSTEVHNEEYRRKHPITVSDVAWGVAMIGTAGAAEYALEGGAAADLLLGKAATSTATGAAACATNTECEETTEHVFWSGGTAARAAAQAYAEAHNAVTLGMTKVGQATDKLTQGMTYEQAADYWDNASAEFASNAQGVARVFLTPQGAQNLGSTWARIEYPLLLVNDMVREIIPIFVSSNSN